MIIQKEIIDKTNLIDLGAHDEGTHWAEKFNIPTVLIETVYLSNKDDRNWIKKQTNKEKIMKAIAEALVKYYLA